MAEPVLSESLIGRCLCEQVSITLERATKSVDICHCAMCRKWGGSFFGGVKGERFSVEGEGNVAIYHSSDWAERAFCRTCGSNLWYHFLPADHFSFLAGLFELPEGFVIDQQIFYDEKPDWFDIAQDSPKKTGAQVLAEAEKAGYSFD